MHDDGYLTIRDVAVLLGKSAATVRHLCASGEFGEHQRESFGRGGRRYEIHIDSPAIPADVRSGWYAEHPDRAPVAERPLPSADDAEYSMYRYNRLTGKEREYCNRWHTILSQADELDPSELLPWLAQRGVPKSTYYRMRKRWLDGGRVPVALARKYWEREQKETIPDRWFKTFAALYLTDSQTSSSGCWKVVLGEASKERDFSFESFPSEHAFMRRLRREYPKHIIYRRRNGPTKHRRKYGHHIKRDYSGVLAGTVWCSDHAQSDVLVRLPNGKLCYPWYTPWIDVKTQKWLGWSIHPESPNSDHIAQAFYFAARQYGIPKDVIIDNGKDFMARDLTGGRKRISLGFDEQYHRSLMGGLTIATHFCRVRNAQGKIIERTFGKVNTMLSRFLFGYRGPSVVQRPEAQREQISRGEIMDYAEWVALFERFIVEVLNREESGAKTLLGGRSPDELWDAEYPQAVESGEVRMVTDDALAMFCRKVSKVTRIDGNGIEDKDLGVRYWAEWMAPHIGTTRVYLRRDRDDAAAPAYVIDAATEKLLGVASPELCVAAIARTPEERLTLRDAIARQNRLTKQADAFGHLDRPDIDIVDSRARAARILAERRGYTPSTANPAPASITLTHADRILAEERERADVGRADFSKLVDPDRKHRQEPNPWRFFATSAGA